MPSPEHHADYTAFADTMTKSEIYEQLLDAVAALVDNQPNWVANCANTASLLYHAFHSMGGPAQGVNWAGFYVLNKRHAAESPQQLILGPFMGKVACQTIDFGRGVCGIAAQTRETQCVANVNEFPGHIACDGDTKSEIVVPILLADGCCVGVIDIDCTQLACFDGEDVASLNKLAQILSRACDWSALL
ncbi:GAF domain-like protein [Nadsonia fulvescens var. elongata DSM 6958]|uniref:GAF domain-like protein n=1 Tax=Nadsonia fulvescens var. elongata DSM 6958 TaxID=857566 RepID=A0A1E3PCI7_9ASCO|nr:GAF domain-like protein [Nadsonia fulvescens var. elongata DSM 6958]